MITITIPHADPSYDVRHGGPPCWSEPLSDAHYVWEKAGTDLRSFAGRRSGDCDPRHVPARSGHCDRSAEVVPEYGFAAIR